MAAGKQQQQLQRQQPQLRRVKLDECTVTRILGGVTKCDDSALEVFRKVFLWKSLSVLIAFY